MFTAHFIITGLHEYAATIIPSKTELHPNHPGTRALSLPSSHGRRSPPAPLSAPPWPHSPPTDLVYRQKPQEKESMAGQLCRSCPSARFLSSWHIVCSVGRVLTSQVSPPSPRALYASLHKAAPSTSVNFLFQGLSLPQSWV